MDVLVKESIGVVKKEIIPIIVEKKVSIKEPASEDIANVVENVKMVYDKPIANVIIEMVNDYSLTMFFLMDVGVDIREDESEVAKRIDL